MLAADEIWMAPAFIEAKLLLKRHMCILAGCRLLTCIAAPETAELSVKLLLSIVAVVCTPIVSAES